MTGRTGVFRWLWSLVRNLTRGTRRDADLDADVRSYVDLLAEEKMAQGLSREEAHRIALVEFGGIESSKEQTRGVRAGARLGELSRDVKYALRTARRTPAFTLAAVLTLALGIGANTAVFSVVNGVLLRDLPYGDPDRIVRFQQFAAANNFGVSARERLMYREETTIFSGFATWYTSSLNLTGEGDAERLPGAVVDPDVFETLRIRALVGRVLEASDADDGAGSVAVLSEGFWTRRFARDPAILGRSITLNGRPRTVVGILPGDARLPGSFTGTPVEVYLPQVWVGPPDPENLHYLDAVARLADGVSLNAASERIRRRASEVRQEIKTLPDTYSARLEPIESVVLGDVRPGLLGVSTAVALLLLVACGNLAGLLLARSSQRTAELSLRTALGASRGRLVRQLLTESVLLSLAGGAVGLALALPGLQLLGALAPDLPRADAIGLDTSVLAFTGAISIATGIAFGVLPAFAVSRRVRLQGSAAGAGRGTTGVPSSGRTLVVVQVALAVALAIGAGLLARSTNAVAAVPAGFDPRGVLTLRITIPAASYPTRADTQRFLDELLTDIRSLPGVLEAGATTHLPLVDDTGDWGVRIEGLPERDADGRRPNADWSAVTPGYFQAMGVRLVEGRLYAAGDLPGTPPVTLINERMAREYFPGRSPIGLRMRMSSTIDPVDREIIGVVADVRHDGLEAAVRRQMFLPLAQFPTGRDTGGGSRSIVVRTAGDPTALAAAIRARLRERDPQVPIGRVATMAAIVGDSTSVRRLYLSLVGTFSVVALAIVCVGVYGLAAFRVTERRRELAVRRALGATPRSIAGIVLREGAMPALLGVTIGVAGALAIASLIDGLLFGVGSRDPATYAAVPAAVVVVTVLASALPIRRAVRDDPSAALRG